jgi:hypothetical protein
MLYSTYCTIHKVHCTQYSTCIEVHEQTSAQSCSFVILSVLYIAYSTADESAYKRTYPQWNSNNSVPMYTAHAHFCIIYWQVHVVLQTQFTSSTIPRRECTPPRMYNVHRRVNCTINSSQRLSEHRPMNNERRYKSSEKCINIKHYQLASCT